MILRGRQRQDVLAIAQDKETCLFANQALLNDDFRAGLTELAGKALIDCRECLVERLSHRHAFAGGKSVRFHDDWRALLPGILFRCFRVCEMPVGGCRDPLPVAEFLGECF